MCCGIQPIVHRAAVFQLIATKEDPELFDEIFEEGNDRSSIINRPNSSGETFLYSAAEKRSLEKVKRLINARPHGADINLANSSKQTPLHIACERESSEIVGELLNAKADTNLTDNLGQTPLHVACEKESPEIVVQLLNAKANVNKANNNRQTPLHIAYVKKNTDITLELLNAGAKDNKVMNMTWLGLDSWHYGIKHIVEEPKMLELLQTWSSADEKSQEEMKVRDKFKDNFKVLTVTLPAAMESQEKEEVQEIVRRWNNKHATKCE